MVSPRPSQMSFLQARLGSRGRELIAGLIGGAALLGLAVTGKADAEVAVLWAVITLGVTLLQAVRPDRRGQVEAKEDQDAPRVEGQAGRLPFAEVIEVLPDPVMIVSAVEADDLIGRRFTYANAAARELLKIQKESGLLVTSIRDPNVLEVADEALFGGLAGETAYDMGGAQDRVLRAIARPLAPADDGASQALLMFRDETEMRRVERTRADFLANASHELRTPLASLTGFIETLRGHARDDAQARDRFLSIMHIQAERMSRLIDDLMSLSRIELNEHVPPSGEVDLTGAVMDVVDAMGPLALERGIRIEPVLPPRGQAIVVGDRDQILQVVQNLVDNAMKYSSSGGAVRINLETGQTAEAAAAAQRPQSSRLALLTPDHGPDRYAALRVADSGPGIAREYLPRLTERFYRVEGQKSGDRMGTGLGLAIVKHIINRHRGGMAVESVTGEGATFTAYFPHSENPQGQSSPEAALERDGSAFVMKVS